MKLSDLPWRDYSLTWEIADVGDFRFCRTKDGGPGEFGTGPFSILRVDRALHSSLDAIEAQCLLNHYLAGNFPEPPQDT